jgi:hypothetical protein
MRGTVSWANARALAGRASVMAMLALFSTSTTASAAGQARDYFLDPPAPGTWTHLDAFTVGTQLSLEQRIELDGDASMLTARMSNMASLGYSETAGHLDLRVMFLTVGGSVGYRDVWKNYSFAPGVSGTNKARRDIDKEHGSTQEDWPFAEGRVRLTVPLDPMFLVTSFATRWEDGPDNSYDWFHTNMHDGGTLYRWDATLFYRHKDFGALGPTVRYMSLPREGKHESEVTFGVTFGRRLGLKRTDDLLLFQLLMAPGDEEFGFHTLRSPTYAMLIYRASFDLWRPERKW